MKKAQMQSGETIIVIIILTILIIFGLFFMSGFQSESANEELREQNQLSGLAIANQLGNLPELRCTRRQTALERCIDLYKAKAFSNYLASNPEFKDERFGNTNISIRIVSPEIYDEEHIYIANASNTNLTSRLPVFVPIILNDPIKKINYFSILEVAVLS